MWMIAMLAGISVFVGSMIFTQETQIHIQAQNYDSALAENILVYRNYVTAYAEANSTASGTVPDSTLAMPVWFMKAKGVSNHVTSGKGYVFYTVTDESVAYTLLKKTNNSINVGVNHSGTLYNPLFGMTSTPVPAAIPNNAITITP